MIEIVKRNIINIFEDMEDPFAAVGDEDNLMGSPSPGMYKNNRSSNNTFKKSYINNDRIRQSNIGAFDFLGGGDPS